MLMGIIATIIGIIRWNSMVKRILAASTASDDGEVFEYKDQKYDKEKAVRAFIDENGRISEKELRKNITDQKKYIADHIKEKNYDKARMLKLQLEAYYRQLGEECPEDCKCEVINKAVSVTNEKLFCYKCGTEIPVDSQFCVKCGEKVVKG